MTDWLLSALVDWGLPLLGIGTFLSCLALPIPSSLMMLSAGGFAASGDLALGGVMGAAYLGAILGDQAGYQLARAAYRQLSDRLTGRRKTALALARAQHFLDQRGMAAVFLSRWLVSPLGPYVNFAAGAARMRRGAFTLGSVTGEAVWVLAYVGLGYSFAASIEALAEIASDVTGLLAGLVLMVGMALWMRHGVRRARLRARQPESTGATPRNGPE
ncbi:MAG: DedA family protein [Rhodobacteraceae bacterium]|nr:DedA family protein [Paracoccaceae bacterium]MBR9822238.1 DedA family protein [Paracoccaceae bacterium]